MTQAKDKLLQLKRIFAQLRRLQICIVQYSNLTKNVESSEFVPFGVQVGVLYKCSVNAFLHWIAAAHTILTARKCI
jgi:hypothetical protein